MESLHIHTFLKDFKIFQGLSNEELESFASIAKYRSYNKKSHVFLHGDPITNIYFICQGTVKIYRTDTQGKEHIVNVLNKGSMFPHQGFFRQDKYPAHAEAIDNLDLISIPLQLFEDLLLTHPEISIKIFRVLGEIIVDLQARLDEKILHTTYEQIMLLLLRLVKKHGVKLEDDLYRIATPFTNNELANMIGSSRETINRTLSKLKKIGYIESDKERYMLIYPNKLRNELSI